MPEQLRLPPGQQLVAAGKWPTIGERAPADPDRPWTLTIAGLVDRARTWSLPELAALPQVEQLVDLHCVTRWSKLNVPIIGVPLACLLEQVGVQSSARYLSFVARSTRRHSSSLPLAYAAKQAMVALAAEGKPLPLHCGGPVRLIVPGRYLYKSVKWLEQIDVLHEDRLGYWEATAGYHNEADPWREQRYIAAGITRKQAAAVLARRNISQQELRSVAAPRRDLTRLTAVGAVLRDANFSHCRLVGACFDGANLSNARLIGADLRRATFRGSDLEGANFSGADLRGADLRGASLVAATFFTPASKASDARPDELAKIDSSTSIDPSSLDELTPDQQAYMRACLRR